MFLMFLCLNNRVCGPNGIASLCERISHAPQPVLRTYYHIARDNAGAMELQCGFAQAALARQSAYKQALHLLNRNSALRVDGIFFLLYS